MRSSECGMGLTTKAQRREGEERMGRPQKEDRKMTDRKIFRFTHATYSAFFIHFSVSDFSVFSLSVFAPLLLIPLSDLSVGHRSACEPDCGIRSAGFRNGNWG